MTLPTAVPTVYKIMQPSRMFYFHVQTCNLVQVQTVSLVLFKKKLVPGLLVTVDNHCWVILNLVVVVLSSFSVLITEIKGFFFLCLTKRHFSFGHRLKQNINATIVAPTGWKL